VRKLISLLAVAVMLTGCSTLAPDGPYAGDKVLYNADLSIATSYDVLHTFVKWEYDNRATLAAKPEVKAAADKIRKGAPQWFSTALALRDAYEQSPSDGTRDALQQAVLVLRAAMFEATKYLAANGGAM
jgi:hypothetical protein